jgi:hypothetical protein
MSKFILMLMVVVATPTAFAAKTTSTPKVSSNFKEHVRQASANAASCPFSNARDVHTVKPQVAISRVDSVLGEKSSVRSHRPDLSTR